MGRRQKRGGRSARRQIAAIEVAALGLGMVAVPHMLGNSLFAAMFRPLSPIGWLLIVAGGAMAFVFRQKAPGHVPGAIVAPAIQPAPNSPRRPSRPAPLVGRIEPVLPAPDGASNAPRTRPMTWGPGVFAVIEWRRFEAVVEALFAQAGFQTKAQSHGPDEGVDVWLYSKNQLDGAPVSVVQCKHWQGKRIGVDKVRELRGVMAAKGVTRGQFATTSTFTPDAVAFADANGIKLHDMPGLLAVIEKRSPEQRQALLDLALEGDYWRPTCVNCGVKMIERSRQDGGMFWGCVNFPKCRTTMQKRAA